MTELHNKLLEISQELGTAIIDKEINPALAKLLNKKISQAINFIPCCDDVVCGNCSGYGYTVDKNGRRKEHCKECE